jgi:hypothetical protein
MILSVAKIISMNLETWWDNSDWGHSKYSEKNVPVVLFHYKSHTVAQD